MRIRPEPTAEVEGQAAKIKQPSADVEAQAMKVKRVDSATPESTVKDSTDDPEVEGHVTKVK